MSPQQLYLYSFLFRNRIQHQEGWRTIITVDMIHQQIADFFKGKKTRNKFAIIDELLLLREKKYIEFESSDTVRSNDLLNISFAHSNDNFVRITYSIYDEFSCRYTYWLYVYISRYGEWGASVSYAELSSLLGVSVTSIRKIIDKLNITSSIPRIYKFSGSYLRGDSPKQELNRYISDMYITQDRLDQYNKFYDATGKAKVKKIKKWNDGDLLYSIHYEEIPITEYIEHQAKSNWGKKDKYNNFIVLDYDDYYIYRFSQKHNINPRWVNKYKALIPFLSQYPWDEWEETFKNDENEQEELNEQKI